MNKQDFLKELKKGLSGLPQDEIEERLTFYSEMIDDRVEEDLTEEDAIAEIGTVDDVISQIMSEIPLSKLVKEKVRPKRTLRVWEIILLVLGSPIWLSLLVGVIAVLIAIYAVIWCAIITLWSVVFALAGCALGGILSGLFFSIQGNGGQGLAMLGAGIACAGLFIFALIGCKEITKGTLWLTKKLALNIKSWFIRKDE